MRCGRHAAVSARKLKSRRSVDSTAKQRAAKENAERDKAERQRIARERVKQAAAKQKANAGSEAIKNVAAYAAAMKKSQNRSNCSRSKA